MKLNLSHTEKALVITLFIELIIIVALFNLGFQEKPKEQTYAVDFVEDDFDFSTLKPEEKLELPDIQKYVNQKYNTNVASNALQEEKSFEEFRQHHEEELQKFYEKRAEAQQIDAGESQPEKKEEQKKETRFTGNSNIRYFIKNRQDIYMANPLYTCPDDMHGLVVIDVEIDRTGKVVSANFNKEKSTTTANCLIESALEAAHDSFFNSDDTAPILQSGYITYNY
jgi:hypothetical protein